MPLYCLMVQKAAKHNRFALKRKSKVVVVVKIISSKETCKYYQCTLGTIESLCLWVDVPNVEL